MRRGKTRTLGFTVSSGRFGHPNFEHFEFESVPLNRDVYLMDEKWAAEWEAAYLDLFDGKDFRNVGYISYAAVRSATKNALEVSWYPNIFDRFHEVSVVLPRGAFVRCIDVYDYDEKPHIFVKGEWLKKLHLKPYSTFALIDAIGVKQALVEGRLTGEKLIELRDGLDRLAGANPGLAFVSFADSLLVKANWFVGQYDSEISYSYEPEVLIRLFPKVAAVYDKVLGMSVYATITQGFNEYADTALIHQSSKGMHVSLNSLGLPFAQLLAIDEAARTAIRLKRHDSFELYADDMFFHSLRFKFGFDKHAQPSGTYSAPMSSSPRKYYCASAKTILDNLDPKPNKMRGRGK
jgi:hypothetical protein